MTKKLYCATFLVAAVLCIALLPTRPALAKTATPLPLRDALIQFIQTRAQSDVNLDKQPESVEGLQILYGEAASAVGMSMTELVDIYEAAYRSAKQARAPEGIDDLLRPNLGWVVAFILLLFLAVQDVVKEYLSRFIRWLFEAIYQHVAGYRPFWFLGLGRYRKALESQFQELKVIFRPERPLKMQEVYVPLHVAESNRQEALDAYHEITKHKRLMIVGAPGAGKSILLRHLGLMYARRGLDDFPQQPMPILLELNRLNDSQEPLIDHLVKILGNYGFPGARGFVEAFLKRGQLLLLFDGLDEVNAASRERVMRAIKDLLPQSEGYHDNHVIITCRTQVNRDEFADWADQTLEIVDFDDQQIQRFLSAWEPDMPKGESKSPDHLVHTLRERPQIMALARNPLLLTMIAYLYTDTAFVLPHSRSEFYYRSVTLLLEQWKKERNRYKASQKRLVLRHLALFSGQGGSDRRNIEVATVLTQMRRVLPDLTLKDEDAQPMLDEIVERSGLLIAIDGGLRYQFTHLTLQEFLAAEALSRKPDQLLKYLAAKPDDWREVARLWCGLEHDSTPLIREIYITDPILAFECLADAQQVDSVCVDELIRAFKSRLLEASGNESLARAMALVAADPRERGTVWFAYILEQLADHQHRLAAAAVLALTNLPKAAEALAEHARRDTDVRPLLIRLGDLAVPTLASWAKQEQAWALDSLHEIGTPLAALAMVPLLWNHEKQLEFGAAWRLAAMLPRPNVETALRTFVLTPAQRGAEYIAWVWEPFDEPTTSSLPVIAGRIAHILNADAPDLSLPPGPHSAFDPRLVIPVCAVLGGDRIKALATEGRVKLVEQFKQAMDAPSISREAFVAKHIEQVSDNPIWRCLFDGLSSDVQFNLLQRLLRLYPTPNADDWRSIFHPVHYVFEKSWQLRGFKLLFVFFIALCLWGLVESIVRSLQLWTWGNALFATFGVVMVAALWWITRVNMSHDLLGLLLALFALSFGPSIGAALGMATDHWIVGGIAGGVAGGVVWGIVLGLMWGNIFGRMTDRTAGGRFARDSVAMAAIGVVFGAVFGAMFSAIGTDMIGTAANSVVSTVGSVVSITLFSTAASLTGNVALIATISFLRAVQREDWRETWHAYFSAIGYFATSGIVVGITVGLLTQTFHSAMGWPGVGLLWFFWIVCVTGVYWHGGRRLRRSQNPLHDLLDEQGLIEIKRPARLFSLVHSVGRFR